MNRRGFTLVELIIVIVIIALLASAGLASYERVQKNARDAKRMGDMRDIKNALLLYRSLNGGALPGNVDNDCYGWDTSADGDFIRGINNPNIMESVPSDPLNINSSACDGNKGASGYNYFYYRYNGTEDFGCPTIGRAFAILTVGNMETSTGEHPNSPGFKCPTGTGTRDWGDDFEYVIGIYE